MSTMTKVIKLGYEVGTGEPVSIPIKHLAVTGQTQEAGKTTTLEALISRSKLRAVTFITKRGEGSFHGARRIEPYFREQADWQFVASILEASRGEKMKFERAWIIRASKGAKTLADVQANVKKALENPKIRGMSEDVYLTLDAYLDVVVPQIERVSWARRVKLSPGVNAVDLAELPLEMQHLVIRSTINWVLEHEKDTVVVVPESWKFIPQGRNTPVKLAAEAYIRQGAALRNYLWLDSQDLGGIEKSILRSVPVWLLGVQRESNEIKRTLDNIPAGTAKPKAADIATLGLGEFIACWKSNAVKTYVQPAWSTEEKAVAVAKGAEPEAPPVTPKQEDKPEMCKQHQKLERELAELQKKFDVRRTQLESVERFRTALVSFLGAKPSTNGHVDEDAIVEKVLARVPARAIGPIQVTPPEKLRKDFQREESERIVGAARELNELQQRILKLVEGVLEAGDYITATALAKRLGRSTGGGSIDGINKAIKPLSGLGFVRVVRGKGVARHLRNQIASDLSAYRATDTEIDAVHQNVLTELAK